MGSRRTPVVVSLLAVAVLAPSGAWYLSASREAERRAARLETMAEAAAQAAVEEQAGRLAGRLEALRQSEARRPFYHYQNLTHEPRGASEGVSIVPSPLASGAVDPMVGGHFQIAPDGRVSLPTVNDDFPELSSDDGYAVYCELMAELEGALVVDGGGAAGEPEVVDVGQEYRLLNSDRGHVVVLSRTQWRQIERANELYALLLTGGGEQAAGSLGVAGADTVAIRVGPLRWHTMVVGSGTLLAALRQVETPNGALVQGFTVSTAAAVPDGGEAETELVFAPSPARVPGWVAAPVAGTRWSLVADAGPAIADARRQGRTQVAGFRRTFAAFFVAALAAAVCVAVIVAQAEALARQRTRFAAAAAHELKTPLSTLRLYSDLLADELGDPARRRDYAGRIAAEAARLGRVVVNILDLSRLERGSPLAEPCEGDIASHVGACAEALRPALDAAGMELLVIFEPLLPPASFDADATCQILTNLLDNAERYSRGTPERRVELHVERSGAWLRVTVSDNGPGIADRRRLFEPFARGPEGDGAQGLGLGLSLARSLARAQGGELRLLADAPGGGARFELTVPVAG